MTAMKAASSEPCTAAQLCDMFCVLVFDQVDFGAHKVVLVRDLSSCERLPQELLQSDAVVMTVPQSKVIQEPQNPIRIRVYGCLIMESMELHVCNVMRRVDSISGHGLHTARSDEICRLVSR